MKEQVSNNNDGGSSDHPGWFVVETSRRTFYPYHPGQHNAFHETLPNSARPKQHSIQVNNASFSPPPLPPPPSKPPSPVPQRKSDIKDPLWVMQIKSQQLSNYKTVAKSLYDKLGSGTMTEDKARWLALQVHNAEVKMHEEVNRLVKQDRRFPRWIFGLDDNTIYTPKQGQGQRTVKWDEEEDEDEDEGDESSDTPRNPSPKRIRFLPFTSKSSRDPAPAKPQRVNISTKDRVRVSGYLHMHD